MLDNKQRKDLVERVAWLIKLRWIASIGVLCSIFVVENFTSASIPVFPLYVVALFLIGYNALQAFILLRFKYKLVKVPSVVNMLANVQISVDLTCLAALIYFSGGAENPFIYYFIFHVIIASILLSQRAAFLQATYAVVLFLSIIFLEYIQVLQHHCLKGIILFCLNDAKIYLLGVSVAFISTVYISLYMATSISKQLREREQKLKVANKLLNENDQIKSKYVLRVTHDIKEDLAAIHSCIEPVTGGILGKISKEQDNMLQRAKKRSSRLIVYVNALLEITKLKLTKELKMEYFEFSKMIQEISGHVKSRVERKEISFIVDAASDIGEMKGVRVYIYETILNILMNAIKYTPSGGKIELKVNKDDSMLLISVQDTGIGIPTDELPHVFEEFYRAKNAREQERQGTGLGLSMAKQIVEMHYGRIWIESKEGEGTKVLIELPLFL